MGQAQAVYQAVHRSVTTCLLRQECESDADLAVAVLATILGLMLCVGIPYLFSFRQGVGRIRRLYRDQRNKRRINAMRLPKRLVDRTSVPGEVLIRPYGHGPRERDLCPVICIVNPLSGGNLGEDLLRRLGKLLAPHQVFDMRDGPLGQFLARYCDHKAQRFYPLRVIICGGDGTVGWVLSQIDAMKYANAPPVAILPLGTGNDLARTLGWGGGFNASDDLLQTLVDVRQSEPVMVDRWLVTIRCPSTEDRDGPVVKELVMTNYFSLGVDAAIALRFHESRLEAPERFNSRTGNKIFYAMLGVEKALLPTPHSLEGNLTIATRTADGPVQYPRLQSDWEGVMVSNLPNYHAGHNFWGIPDPRLEPQLKPLNVMDGLIEVMAVGGSLHMAAIHTELYDAHRLGQCGHVTLWVKSDMHMQVDGEPWLQAGPSQVTIAHFQQYPFLKRVDGKPHYGIDCETETDAETETEPESDSRPIRRRPPLGLHPPGVPSPPGRLRTD